MKKARFLAALVALATLSAAAALPAPAGFSFAKGAKFADADLCFVDMDGNGLPFEIDTWNASGESLIWVRLPSMTNGTEFVMCWGGGTSGKTVCDASPFSGYVGVWHMSEASGTVADSSGHSLDAVPTGEGATTLSIAVSGPVGSVDECRLLDAVPGADWAWAEYASMNDASFLTAGEAESYGELVCLTAGVSVSDISFTNATIVVSNETDTLRISAELEGLSIRAYGETPGDGGRAAFSVSPSYIDDGNRIHIVSNAATDVTLAGFTCSYGPRSLGVQNKGSVLLIAVAAPRFTIADCEFFCTGIPGYAGSGANGIVAAIKVNDNWHVATGMLVERCFFHDTTGYRGDTAPQPLRAPPRWTSASSPGGARTTSIRSGSAQSRRCIRRRRC